MKFSLISVIFLWLILSCSGSTDENKPVSESLFYKGMDLSFQPELESHNISYKDNLGKSINLLDYVSKNGTNLVRLKLWHTPQNGENSLQDVKSYAKRVKNKNISFLLNIHYSDYWADPSQQTPPRAWQNMSFQEIKTAIYEYTKYVVEELKNENTLPEIIQIGNETDSGFLWNHGKIWDEFSDNWENYVALINEAIRGIKAIDTDNKIKIMLHHSSVEKAIYLFNELKPYNIDFDIIGLSYYPQFQTKNLSLVESKLDELATTFDKDILLVEVAYPFTLLWNDNSTNYIGDTSQILNEFPATPEGQKNYLEWLILVIKNIPNNKGIGLCYWAPDWVAFDGNETTSTLGSAWENQCLFDFEHKSLPAFEVYRTN